MHTQVPCLGTIVKPEQLVIQGTRSTTLMILALTHVSCSRTRPAAPTPHTACPCLHSLALVLGAPMAGLVQACLGCKQNIHTSSLTVLHCPCRCLAKAQNPPMAGLVQACLGCKQNIHTVGIDSAALSLSVPGQGTGQAHVSACLGCST